MQFSIEKSSREVLREASSWSIRGFRAVKEVVSDYYAPIFSRKAGVPICATLCVLTIVSYALLHG